MNTKKYIARWEEPHSVIVEAKNAEEAREQALSGDYQAQSDESAELSSDVEVQEV